MLGNATNQRSLAFLDQKLAIMYNYDTSLVKCTFNEKRTIEQIEKNNYSIIILNLFLSFVIKNDCNNNKYISKLYYKLSW